MNAEQWNARYPVGTPVVAYPFVRPEHLVAVRYREAVAAGLPRKPEDDPCTRLVTVTRSRAEVLGGHTDVVWVDGHGACISLDHVDVLPRTDTPDRTVTTIKVKRACNGCGALLGDLDNRDVDKHGNLTDVRTECTRCAPLVELEAQGCRTWQLTPRNITAVDDVVDRDGIYAKGYFESDGDKTVCVGLRIGAG